MPFSVPSVLRTSGRLVGRNRRRRVTAAGWLTDLQDILSPELAIHSDHSPAAQELAATATLLPETLPPRSHPDLAGLAAHDWHHPVPRRNEVSWSPDGTPRNRHACG